MEKIETDLVGYFDGYRGGEFYGWAWIPSRPGHRVELELLVNGFTIARMTASEYRADLRAGSIGDGRHGFSIPVELDTDRSGPVKVVVRTLDGTLLSGGERIFGNEPPPSEAEEAAFNAFVAAVLGTAATVDRANSAAPDPKINFIVHAAKADKPLATVLGASEYSYSFVMNAFVPLLKQFGTVHVVDDPVRDANLLCKAHLSMGETCLFLSFAPPHRTILGLPCPTIPVVAWEFPTIPSTVFDGDARHDWRMVLRQTGRAITLSTLATQAVKRAMGADFPVVTIPAPVWDRHPLLGLKERRRPAVGGTALALPAFVFDTRRHDFELEMATPPVPPLPPAEALTDVTLDGVVFTAVLAPQDGRKNWPDLVTAFVSAFLDQPSATFVLKMVCTDIAIWWEKLHSILSRLPKFSCRILVVQGYLDEEEFVSLVQTSHWVVNASTAEGLCLPLVEFMCDGCPAIAPRHTAMLDYIDDTNALIVESSEEYCSWPQDPRNELTTTRHRVSWSALSAAMAEGHRIASGDPVRYAAMSEAARASMAAFCDDRIVGAKLNSFLGLGRPQSAPAASALIRLSEAAC